jgi:hypothetical protein
MRPRTEAVLGLAALVLVSFLLSRSRTAREAAREGDRRPSIYLTGPLGAKGLAEALRRTGTEVRPFRRGFRSLPVDSAGRGGTLLALLDPSEAVEGYEVELVRHWSDQSDRHALLLAGDGTEALMRCFGFALDARVFDSVTVQPVAPFASDRSSWPRVAGLLAATTESVVVDSSRMLDAGLLSCAVPPFSRVDTLLRTGAGRAVALRLHRADTGGEVLLMSDAGLLRNRVLRESAAGPLLLGLIAGRYPRVLFEEAHHGFGESGSLAAATVAWSLRSPWGWAMWQVAAVGLLALLAGAVRFGPPLFRVDRQRRSPLEHVRALATALAAARGHDVAIGSIVQGLRRRLHPAGRAPRESWQAWLDQLADQVRSRRAVDAIQTLRTLTRPGQSQEGVLRAANAVEDVWEELHH